MIDERTSRAIGSLVAGKRLSRFGRYLSGLREAKGLRIRDVASVVGIPCELMYDIECGRRGHLGLWYWPKIIRLLGASWEQMLFLAAEDEADEKRRSKEDERKRSRSKAKRNKEASKKRLAGDAGVKFAEWSI